MMGRGGRQQRARGPPSPASRARVLQSNEADKELRKQELEAEKEVRRQELEECKKAARRAAMPVHPSNKAHTTKKLEFADSWHLG